MRTSRDDSALDELLPLEAMQGRFGEILTWLQEILLDINIAIQIGLVAAAFIPALIFGPRLRHLVEAHTRELDSFLQN